MAAKIRTMELRVWALEQQQQQQQQQHVWLATPSSPQSVVGRDPHELQQADWEVPVAKTHEEIKGGISFADGQVLMYENVMQQQSVYCRPFEQQEVAMHVPAVPKVMQQQGVYHQSGVEQAFQDTVYERVDDDFECELGAQAPVGFWDPVGIYDGSVDMFDSCRQIDLKYGRFSMYACMGYLCHEIHSCLYMHFPSAFESELGVQVPVGVWDSAGLADVGSVEEHQRCRQAELKLVRIYMHAYMSYICQEVQVGLYTDPPLSAFESELDVRAPVGFWDPAGLIAEGSGDNSHRFKKSELKHGRISMLVIMGHLKFAHLPNGLATIFKVPAAGWAQILAYMAFCEAAQDQFHGAPDDAGADADEGGSKELTSSDPAEKTKKFNAEISKGSLAMMGIVGMFFQDGLVPSCCRNWVCYMVDGCSSDSGSSSHLPRHLRKLAGEVQVLGQLAAQKRLERDRIAAELSEFERQLQELSS